MHRALKLVTILSVLSAVGCATKMGNFQMSVLEGLSHPTNTVERTEKVSPVINQEVK